MAHISDLEENEHNIMQNYLGKLSQNCKYTNINDYREEDDNKLKDLRILHINIQSLPSKFQNLVQFMNFLKR